MQVHIGYATLLLDIAVHTREVGEEAVGGGAVVRAAVSGGAEFLHTGLSSAHSLLPPSLPAPTISVPLCIHRDRTFRGSQTYVHRVQANTLTCIH